MAACTLPGTHHSKEHVHHADPGLGNMQCAHSMTPPRALMSVAPVMSMKASSQDSGCTQDVRCSIRQYTCAGQAPAQVCGRVKRILRKALLPNVCSLCLYAAI